MVRLARKLYWAFVGQSLLGCRLPRALTAAVLIDHQLSAQLCGAICHPRGPAPCRLASGFRCARQRGVRQQEGPEVNADEAQIDVRYTGKLALAWALIAPSCMPGGMPVSSSQWHGAPREEGQGGWDHASLHITWPSGMCRATRGAGPYHCRPEHALV